MRPKTTRKRSVPPGRPSFQAALVLWIGFSFVGWLAIVGLASVLVPHEDEHWAGEDSIIIDVAPASGPD